MQRGISSETSNLRTTLYFSKIKTTQVVLLHTKSTEVNVKVAKKTTEKVLVTEKNYYTQVGLSTQVNAFCYFTPLRGYKPNDLK